MIILNESYKGQMYELLTLLKHIMTAKEKAKELILKFAFKGAQHEGEAKKFALIAVGEILEMDLPILEEDADKFYDYWEEVKHEINNI